MKNLNDKISIKSLSAEALAAAVEDLGQPTFRTKQILQWLYCDCAKSFDEMTNLPKTLREQLSEEYFVSALKAKEVLESRDGSIKFLFESCCQKNSGAVFETVLIPNGKINESYTVCVSSQAGCNLGCKFCATGQQKFLRNLYMGEIVDQLLYARNYANATITNVVVMGQGEPFLNYDNVISAMQVINKTIQDPIGARKITISTAGIIYGIEKFCNVKEQFGLAVSLHCANQEIRDTLMPGVKQYNLQRLKQALIDYIEKTNRRVTLEYILLRGINDGDNCLEKLIDFCNGLLVHVNIIEFNKIDNCNFAKSDGKTISKWSSGLKARGINTTIRRSGGQDIAGACGQLSNKHEI